jgi:hypothetical protein
MEEEILVEGLEDNEPFYAAIGDIQDVYDEVEPVEENENNEVKEEE